MKFETNREFAEALDYEDELAAFRSRFLIPTNSAGTELIYFVGHSLGLQPRATRTYVAEELEAWARRGVNAHFEGSRPWTRYHDVIGGPMARVVGARTDEVVLMNALTVNLHLMMLSFYRPAQGRYKIVMEDHAFPSDHYAVASQVRLHGLDPAATVVALKSRVGEHALRREDICAAISELGAELALVMLGGVNYYTGQAFDLQEITRSAHQVGATVGFDLAHAAGNVEVQLHDWNVDFAVWCTYKYLNSGPGSLSGCFVHQRHHDRDDLPRLAGWWGEDLEKRFRMQDDFEPARGAAGWQISNPNVLSLGAIRASLALFEEAGLERLRAKQRLLTGYLEFLLNTTLEDRVSIITPTDPAHRGSQLSLLLRSRGREVYEALLEAGVVCDWRNPNVIRIAPVPLYNQFDEVWRFVKLLDSLA